MAGCTQRQLHDSLVVVQGLVLAAHGREVQLVSHLAVALGGEGGGGVTARGDVLPTQVFLAQFYLADGCKANSCPSG